MKDTRFFFYLNKILKNLHILSINLPFLLTIKVAYQHSISKNIHVSYTRIYSIHTNTL